MKPEYYILMNGQIKNVAFMEWAKWFETANRTIALTNIKTSIGEFCVSTVFLGVDHNYNYYNYYSNNGDPILLETAVFNGEHTLEIDRYSTVDEALLGHERLVGAVQRLEIWPRQTE